MDVAAQSCTVAAVIPGTTELLRFPASVPDPFIFCVYHKDQVTLRTLRLAWEQRG